MSCQGKKRASFKSRGGWWWCGDIFHLNEIAGFYSRYLINFSYFPRRNVMSIMYNRKFLK